MNINVIIINVIITCFAFGLGFVAGAVWGMDYMSKELYKVFKEMIDNADKLSQAVQDYVKSLEETNDN